MRNDDNVDGGPGGGTLHRWRDDGGFSDGGDLLVLESGEREKKLWCRVFVFSQFRFKAYGLGLRLGKYYWAKVKFMFNPI